MDQGLLSGEGHLHQGIVSLGLRKSMMPGEQFGPVVAQTVVQLLVCDGVNFFRASSSNFASVQIS